MPTTLEFEASLLTQYPNPASQLRGLQAGATYRLRQYYLAGVTDPAAHTLAKNNARQLKALTDTGNLAAFDAITSAIGGAGAGGAASFVGELATLNETVSGTTKTFTVAAAKNAAVGDLVETTMMINSAVITLPASVVDSKGNTHVLVTSTTAGSPAPGARTGKYRAILTAALTTGDTLIITPSASARGGGIMTAYRGPFTGDSTTVLAGSALGASGAASAAVTTVAVTGLDTAAPGGYLATLAVGYQLTGQLAPGAGYTDAPTDHAGPNTGTSIAGTYKLNGAGASESGAATLDAAVGWNAILAAYKLAP